MMEEVDGRNWRERERKVAGATRTEIGGVSEREGKCARQRWR